MYIEHFKLGLYFQLYPATVHLITLCQYVVQFEKLVDPVFQFPVIIAIFRIYFCRYFRGIRHGIQLVFIRLFRQS